MFSNGAGDKILGGFVAVVGTLLASYLGGWDTPLHVLITFLVLDYLTGIIKGIAKRNLASSQMFIGGLRKALILVVVGVAVMLDSYMGNTSPIFRTMALYYYSAMEGLSLLENLGAIGVPLPPFLVNVLQQLKAKADEESTK